jgi:hypothetical protein
VVYHSDSLYFENDRQILKFMSDREAGVFYIMYGELVGVDEPWGIYEKICVAHYTNYGETLVGTYCHDLMMNYPESCTGVLDMEAEVREDNNVALRWRQPQTEQPILAYYLYRDGVLLTELQQTDFLDEDLPNGKYTYHVRVVYADSCESLSYNTVKVAIDFTGIGEKGKEERIVLYPNPTTGQLRIENGEWRIENVEIFDILGRTVVAYPCGCPENTEITLYISNLPTGMYFVRIQTERGVVVRKVLKR